MGQVEVYVDEMAQGGTGLIDGDDGIEFLGCVVYLILAGIMICFGIGLCHWVLITVWAWKAGAP